MPDKTAKIPLGRCLVARVAVRSAGVTACSQSGIRGEHMLSFARSAAHFSTSFSPALGVCQIAGMYQAFLPFHVSSVSRQDPGRAPVPYAKQVCRKASVARAETAMPCDFVWHPSVEMLDAAVVFLFGWDCY